MRRRVKKRALRADEIKLRFRAVEKMQAKLTALGMLSDRQTDRHWKMQLYGGCKWWNILRNIRTTIYIHIFKFHTGFIPKSHFCTDFFSLVLIQFQRSNGFYSSIVIMISFFLCQIFTTPESMLQQSENRRKECTWLIETSSATIFADFQWWRNVFKVFIPFSIIFFQIICNRIK